MIMFLLTGNSEHPVNALADDVDDDALRAGRQVLG